MNKVKYESLLNCKEGKELDFICDNIKDVSIERILETLNSGSLVYVNPAATYEQLRVAIRYFNSTDENMKQKIIELFLNEYKPEDTDNCARKDKPECTIIRMPIDKGLINKLNIFGSKREIDILKRIANDNDNVTPFMDGYRPQFYFKNIKDYDENTVRNDIVHDIGKQSDNSNSETDVVKIALNKASEALNNYKKREVLNPEPVDFSKVTDNIHVKPINNEAFSGLFKHIYSPSILDSISKIDVERFIEENTITTEDDDVDDYRELDIELTLRKSTFINTLNNAIEFLETLVDDIDENYTFEDDEEKYQELVSKVIFNHLIQLSLGKY